MIGVGITMEGINQNEIMYEFVLEQSWRSPLNQTEIDDWYFLFKFSIFFVKRFYQIGYLILFGIDILVIFQCPVR